MTDPLTKGSDRVVSEHFSKNGIYEGQQRSIIYCGQSPLAHHGINLCLRLFLCCWVYYHHEKEGKQDRVGLVYIVSCDDYHTDMASRTVSDAANKTDIRSNESRKASERHTQKRTARCVLERLHPRFLGQNPILFHVSQCIVYHRRCSGTTWLGITIIQRGHKISN